MKFDIKALTLLLATGAGFCLGSISDIFPNESPHAFAMVEGRRSKCNTLKPKCNTLIPEDKYFKKPKNKKSRLHVTIDQSWTFSTDGTIILEKVQKYRSRKDLEKDLRAHSRREESSASFSVSEDSSFKHGHKSSKSKKPHKRAFSFEGSAEEKRKSLRKSKSSKKSNNKCVYVEVRPRKHRHHTRRITVDEETESSTYAFDVKRRTVNRRSESESFSNSFSSEESEVSIKKKYHGKPKHSKKHSGKKHSKRGEPLIEGKKSKKPYYASISLSSVSESGSQSASSSSYTYELKRVPACPCPAPCCPKKTCEKASKRTKKPCGRSKNSRR